MPEFAYEAANEEGRKNRGRLAAADRSEAVQILRAQGLTPLLLKEDSPKPAISGTESGRGRFDILVFTQQLAALTEAGLQLDRALGILADLGRADETGRIAGAIRRDVQEGAAFSTALARHPRRFNRIYVNMVRAGEVSGLLPLILGRLAQSIEEERDLNSFILSAVLYPAVVAAASLTAIGVLMLWVVPRFEMIFARLDRDLPSLTKGILAVSRGLHSYGLWILALVAAVAIALYLAARSPAGRDLIDRRRLNLPLFGDLQLKLATAKIMRTMALLVQAGVPVLQSLSVVKETVGNTVIRAGLDRAGREITEGGGIARRLEAQKILPPLAIRMIAVGEETGELPSMLVQVARNYDREVRRTVRNLLSLLEPALILVLTGVTLLIALAIMVPIVRMSSGR